MSRDSSTSNGVPASNGVYKTPPIRIGAGLSRSKLITGGTSGGAKPPSIKLSSALKSPTRIGISGSGLTPVSRANSERYQSSYTRFETLRNASFPALSDPDISDKTGTEVESSKPVRQIEKNGSAKRASYPSFTSPIIGSSSTYIDMQGQNGALKSQYSESSIEANGVANKGAGRRGDFIIADNNKSDKELAKHRVDNKAPSALSQVKDIVEVELPARPKTERIPYDGRMTQLQANVVSLTKGDGFKQEKDLTKTITEASTKPYVVNDLSVQKVESITPEKNDAVQNFVAPPRRRRARSRDSLDSSNEAKTVNTPRTTGSNKPETEAAIGLLGSVTPPVPVSSVASPDVAREREADEMDGAPSPMLRTRRRLTQRKKSFKKLEDDEYIGFASLPEQVHRKAVRRGFEFTLMVVGETGLGKSTLINSLFLTDLYKDRKVGKIEERIQKTVELEKKELEIEEKGVKLKLTIVDTPGFSDAVNAEESWKPIANYIDKQFESYFKAESGLNRKNIHDSRVHCCLYFISPYGHGLRPVDVLVMKKLHNKVNIVPLVAKSDMLTKKEIKALKEKVLTEIQKHKIQIYQFPDCDSDEDEDFKQQDQELKKAIPFAVVGSNTVVEAGGKKIRGRMYPWGIVEVENPSHCDFVKLRQMLISTHMQDLKDVTCDVHYENYRAEHISEQMTGQQRERGKLKRESVTNMDKVMDTERLLQEKEAEIKRMQEMLAKMQSQLNQNSPKLNGKVAAV